MRQRSEVLGRAAGTSYDVCVIGGGASGAGCALDGQLRGLKTLLLDAGDFGCFTSTASTKLIHGGLRYLEQAIMEFDAGQFPVLWRALRERRLMMRNAPHLTGIRQFAVPCFTFAGAAYYDIGLKFYDWLSGEASLSRSHFLNRKGTLARMPWLQPRGLFGTVIYADGQFDDARYNLALVQSCSALGGEVLNYARVLSFEKDQHGKLVAAQVEDRESGETFRITAEVFVNATGPFSDGIRRLANPGAAERLSVSKGVHILLPLPADFGEEALLIPRTEDGRVIFAIPWQGRLLVGTTETEATLETEMIVTRAESEYLLRHLNHYLARPFELADIVNAIAGLRPLIRAGDSRDTKRMIRDYEIEVLPQSGLISVLGGKWTVYRAMAEDAINAVELAVTGKTRECRTRCHLLYGSEDQPGHLLKELIDSEQISVATAQHLIRKFGSHAQDVFDLARESSTLLSPLVAGAPQIRAEVVYCIREEMAVCVEDVLSRRLGLQSFDMCLAMKAAPEVAEILASELGWSTARTNEEASRYTQRICRLEAEMGAAPARVEARQ